MSAQRILVATAKFAAVGVERVVCPASRGGRRLVAELRRLVPEAAQGAP